VRVVIALAAVVVAGCATLWPGADRVARGDRFATEGNLDGALREYEAALAQGAGGDVGLRARAGRSTVMAAIEAREQLKRVRAELTRVTDEIAARERELTRLGKDLASRDSEIARLRRDAEQLRASLEDLKRLEIQLERRR
jgi:chromosome segregation ATPase